MTPILCVGETQHEHDSGRALDVVLRQLQRGLDGTSADDHVTTVVIAYEPVWAIGTGRTATPEQARIGPWRDSRRDPRTLRPRARAMRSEFSMAAASTTENVDSLVCKPDIDGALVGGASLKADSFARIVQARTG